MMVFGGSNLTSQYMRRNEMTARGTALHQKSDEEGMKLAV